MGDNGSDKRRQQLFEYLHSALPHKSEDELQIVITDNQMDENRINQWLLQQFEGGDQNKDTSSIDEGTWNTVISKKERKKAADSTDDGKYTGYKRGGRGGRGRSMDGRGRGRGTPSSTSRSTPPRRAPRDPVPRNHNPNPHARGPPPRNIRQSEEVKAGERNVTGLKTSEGGQGDAPLLAAQPQPIKEESPWIRAAKARPTPPQRPSQAPPSTQGPRQGGATRASSTQRVPPPSSTQRPTPSTSDPDPVLPPRPTPHTHTPHTSHPDQDSGVSANPAGWEGEEWDSSATDRSGEWRSANPDPSHINWDEAPTTAPTTTGSWAAAAASASNPKPSSNSNTNTTTNTAGTRAVQGGWGATSRSRVDTGMVDSGGDGDKKDTDKHHSHAQIQKEDQGQHQHQSQQDGKHHDQEQQQQQHQQQQQQQRQDVQQSSFFSSPQPDNMMVWKPSDPSPTPLSTLSPATTLPSATSPPGNPTTTPPSLPTSSSSPTTTQATVSNNTVSNNTSTQSIPVKLPYHIEHLSLEPSESMFSFGSFENAAKVGSGKVEGDTTSAPQSPLLGDAPEVVEDKETTSYFPSMTHTPASAPHSRSWSSPPTSQPADPAPHTTHHTHHTSHHTQSGGGGGAEGAEGSGNTGGTAGQFGKLSATARVTAGASPTEPYQSHHMHQMQPQHVPPHMVQPPYPYMAGGAPGAQFPNVYMQFPYVPSPYPQHYQVPHSQFGYSPSPSPQQYSKPNQYQAGYPYPSTSSYPYDQSAAPSFPESHNSEPLNNPNLGGAGGAGGTVAGVGGQTAAGYGVPLGTHNPMHHQQHSYYGDGQGERKEYEGQYGGPQYGYGQGMAHHNTPRSYQ